MCSPIASRYSAHMEDQPTAMSARTYARFSIQECKFNGANTLHEGHRFVRGYRFVYGTYLLPRHLRGRVHGRGCGRLKSKTSRQKCARRP